MASSRVLPASYNTHTFGTVGAGRDYQSIATWESDHTIDLSIADKGEVLDCYDDAASFDQSGITIAGATNSTATRFRLIRAPVGQCHDGTPNNGFTIASSVAATGITFSENYAQIWDIIEIKTINSASSFFCISLNATNTKAIGCIVKCTNAGAGAGRGIGLNQYATYAINCLTYECKTYGFQTWVETGITNYILNCNSINCSKGIEVLGAAGGTVVVTNCIGQDNASGDFLKGANVTATVTYCLSKDTTADDWGGTGNLISKDLSFVNEAGDDWHLASGDTDAINAGADLSATFDDDIDFTVRSSWDIGFDEYVAAAQSILPLVGFGTLGGNANPMMA